MGPYLETDLPNLKPIVVIALAALTALPAMATTYQFRVGVPGVTASTQGAFGIITPADVFASVATDRSAVAIVPLSNTGKVPLTILGVAANGMEAPGDFSQTNDCGSSLAVAAQCAITVSFAPSVLGARTGRLVVNTDMKPQPALSLALSGTGIAPPSSAALGALTPSSAFSSVVTNAQATASVSFTNTGRAPISISGVGITSNQVTGEFSQTNNCGATLAAGAQCTITVKFMPTATGARSGTLTITTNISGQPTTVLALSGTATPPPVATIVGGAWSDGTYAKSCLDYLTGDATHVAASSNGTYTIKPASVTYSVTCDMTGGGWTRFANMIAGTASWPGDNANAVTARVSSSYTQMYRDIAGVSTNQRIDGISGSSESCCDAYRFVDANNVSLVGLASSYKGNLPTTMVTVPINRDWTKALWSTTFSTDGSVNTGLGGYITNVTWFK